MRVHKRIFNLFKDISFTAGAYNVSLFCYYIITHQLNSQIELAS
jgi:hypothetical protein